MPWCNHPHPPQGAQCLGRWVERHSGSREGWLGSGRAAAGLAAAVAGGRRSRAARRPAMLDRDAEHSGGQPGTGEGATAASKGRAPATPRGGLTLQQPRQHALSLLSPALPLRPSPSLPGLLLRARSPRHLGLLCGGRRRAEAPQHVGMPDRRARAASSLPAVLPPGGTCGSTHRSGRPA